MDERARADRFWACEGRGGRGRDASALKAPNYKQQITNELQGPSTNSSDRATLAVLSIWTFVICICVYFDAWVLRFQRYFAPFARAFAVALMMASLVIVALEVASTPLTLCLAMILAGVSVMAA